MAIAIKSIPTLKGDAAKTFTKKADRNSQNRATVNFREHVRSTHAILEKAKMK